jgi:hypothetical protein
MIVNNKEKNIDQGRAFPQALGSSQRFSASHSLFSFMSGKTFGSSQDKFTPLLNSRPPQNSPSLSRVSFNEAPREKEVSSWKEPSPLGNRPLSPSPPEEDPEPQSSPAPLLWEIRPLPPRDTGRDSQGESQEDPFAFPLSLSEGGLILEDQEKEGRGEEGPIGLISPLLGGGLLSSTPLTQPLEQKESHPLLAPFLSRETESHESLIPVEASLAFQSGNGEALTFFQGPLAGGDFLEEGDMTLPSLMDTRLQDDHVFNRGAGEEDTPLPLLSSQERTLGGGEANGSRGFSAWQREEEMGLLPQTREENPYILQDHEREDSHMGQEKEGLLTMRTGDLLPSSPMSLQADLEEGQEISFQDGAPLSLSPSSLPRGAAEGQGPTHSSPSSLSLLSKEEEEKKILGDVGGARGPGVFQKDPLVQELKETKGKIEIRTPLQNFSLSVGKAVGEGLNRFQVRLDPESLGKVDLTLEIRDDNYVHAILSIEKQSTLDLLQRDAGQLAEIFQGLGLLLDEQSLNFNLQQEGHPQSFTPSERLPSPLLAQEARQEDMLSLGSGERGRNSGYGINLVA